MTLTVRVIVMATVMIKVNLLIIVTVIERITIVLKGGKWCCWKSSLGSSEKITLFAYCTELQYSELYCAVLSCAVLYCTALHHTAVHSFHSSSLLFTVSSLQVS
jgi:hypothetical protein